MEIGPRLWYTAGDTAPGLFHGKTRRSMETTAKRDGPLCPPLPGPCRLLPGPEDAENAAATPAEKRDDETGRMENLYKEVPL